MAIALAVDPLELSEAPQLGGYRLIDRLCDGGMASIFLGEDTQTGEIVAIKTPRHGLPHEIAALDREISTLAGLRHPGVVKLLANGQKEGLPWMALELLRGRTLFQELSTMWTAGHQSIPGAPSHPVESPRSATSEAARRFQWTLSLEADPVLASPRRAPAAGRLADVVGHVAGLASALDYIHAQGIVHRDLKPENIFLGDDDGCITLFDFGLAFRTAPATEAGEPSRLCLATVEYAAPELVCGYPVDARADIYSLGCILYELVTGHRPFEGGAPDEIARKHVDSEPVCPSTWVAGLSWGLEDLILSMLAKNPVGRPSSAGRVADRLVRVVRAA